MTTARKPNYIAYTVTGTGERARWIRIGAAWSHRSGEGLNIELAANPLDGRIVLMPPKAETEDAS